MVGAELGSRPWIEVHRVHIKVQRGTGHRGKVAPPSNRLGENPCLPADQHGDDQQAKSRCECLNQSMGLQVPRADRWPTQVQEAFGFLEELGFLVVDSGTYRLGDWTLLGNGYAGIHLDCDGDTRSLQVKLIRL